VPTTPTLPSTTIDFACRPIRMPACFSRTGMPPEPSARNRPALRETKAGGEAAGLGPRFYLWTNDYGRAAVPYPPGVREARLWYWKRKQPEPPKPPGYWKWEASVTQDGTCHVPQRAQIEQFLADTLATLP